MSPALCGLTVALWAGIRWEGSLSWLTAHARQIARTGQTGAVSGRSTSAQPNYLSATYHYILSSKNRLRVETLSSFSIDSTAGFGYTEYTSPDLNINETRNANMNEPKLAERLLDLRTERGLTQEEVAEKIGVSNKTYSKWARCSTASARASRSRRSMTAASPKPKP